MTDPDYNLLDEAWIPVRLLDGSVEKMGLLDVFRNTNEIADLACELPTQKIAIQRILLAVCYRVASLESAKDWRGQWDTGAPTDEALAYLERWRDRFYLFGGPRPFMQTPDLRTAKGAVSGLEKIIADIPNGEQFFTTRHTRAIARIPADEAALWLVHAHAYDPSGIRSGAVGDPETKGGKGYPIGPSWCGQTGTVLLKGKNLDETLVLNLVPFDSGSLQGPDPMGDKGTCTWEAEDVETAQRRDYSRDGDPDPAGISIPRLFTWHSRRIRLVGDRSGVTGVVLAQGDKLAPQNMQRFEPMSLWRYSMPQSKKFREHTYMPRKHEPGRALWRNLPGILPGLRTVDGFDKTEQTEFLSSQTLSFHKRIEQGPRTRYPVRVRVEAVGVTYGPKEATFEDLYHDELSFSTALLKEKGPGLPDLIDSQVRGTEQVASHVGVFAANLARAAGQSGEGAGDGARSRAKEQFFALVDDPFRRWLARLDGDSDVDAARGEWHGEVRRIVRLLAKRLVDEAPPSATIGRDTGMVFMNTGIAENFLWAAVNKTMPRTEDQVKEGEK